MRTDRSDEDREERMESGVSKTGSLAARGLAKVPEAGDKIGEGLVVELRQFGHALGAGQTLDQRRERLPEALLFPEISDGKTPGILG